MLENISFKKVAQEDKALACLRLLSAEEPASRFAQLRKLVLKQINDKKEKPQSFQNAQKLALSINHLFGDADKPQALSRDRLFSLIVALDDLRLFRLQAFEIWRRGLIDDDGEAFDSITLPAIIGDLVEHLKLNEAQTLWLSFVYCCAPQWQSVLIHEESSESKERFLSFRNVLAEVENVSLTSAPDMVHILARLQSISLVGPLRPALIILVEGQSEAILLPAFARLLNIDLEKSAVQIIASGGSQQVGRRYLSYRDLLKIPVFCLLDADAAESATLIEDSLREDHDDELFVLASGELEDSFSYEFLMTVLAQQMRLQGHTISTDLSALSIPRHGKRKSALERLFRVNGLGDFDKLEFAEIAASLLKSRDDVPEELQDFLLLVGNKVGAES